MGKDPTIRLPFLGFPAILRKGASIKTAGTKTSLVRGFNPIEKYQSKWESSPNGGEHKKYLKPPPSSGAFFVIPLSVSDVLFFLQIDQEL